MRDLDRIAARRWARRRRQLLAALQLQLGNERRARRWRERGPAIPGATEEQGHAPG